MLWWSWLKVVLAALFLVYVLARHRVVVRRRALLRPHAHGRRHRMRG